MTLYQKSDINILLLKSNPILQGVQKSSFLKKMDPKDQNEELDLAKKAFAYMLESRGFTLNANSKRDLQNLAKKFGVPFEKVQNFVRPFVQKMVDDVFGKPKPGLN